MLCLLTEGVEAGFQFFMCATFTLNSDTVVVPAPPPPVEAVSPAAIFFILNVLIGLRLWMEFLYIINFGSIVVPCATSEQAISRMKPLSCVLSASHCIMNDACGML